MTIPTQTNAVLSWGNGQVIFKGPIEIVLEPQLRFTEPDPWVPRHVPLWFAEAFASYTRPKVTAFSMMFGKGPDTDGKCRLKFGREDWGVQLLKRSIRRVSAETLYGEDQDEDHEL